MQFSIVLKIGSGHPLQNPLRSLGHSSPSVNKTTLFVKFAVSANYEHARQIQKLERGDHRAGGNSAALREL
jgi:hypothetical protein